MDGCPYVLNLISTKMHRCWCCQSRYCNNGLPTIYHHLLLDTIQRGPNGMPQTRVHTDLILYTLQVETSNKKHCSRLTLSQQLALQFRPRCRRSHATFTPPSAETDRSRRVPSPQPMQASTPYYPNESLQIQLTCLQCPGNWLQGLLSIITIVTIAYTHTQKNKQTNKYKIFSSRKSTCKTN